MISKGNVAMVAESSTEIPVHNIGTRIECCGHIGTIKYIGTVEGYPGIWFGIDWDDVNRGKHDGSLNGVQYYETRYPKSGSFVRTEKVNFGQSLVETIVSRYGEMEDELTSKIKEQQLLKFQQSINAPFLKMVGFDKVADKQSNFETLQVVNVRLLNVSSPGKPGELKRLCPHIRELDISKNLLSNWTDIFDICSQLEYLIWLNVSENMLILPENYEQYIFPNIRTLICGYMNLTWADVMKITTVFPNVDELRVPFNDINEITEIDSTYLQCLRILDLEGNNIGRWSEIKKLSVIPNLKYMNLDNIQLTNIEFEGTAPTVDIFRKLTKLNINNNLINDWKSITELNRLSNLEDLRFIRNPVLESENFATREQLIIAKLGKLRILNGRQLRPEERRGAEYDYIKKYGLEWLKVKDTSERENFLIEHNRYLELIERYGTPEESELVIQPNILKSSLISLTIVHEDRVITKKLPPSILVQKLVMLVQKLFRLEDRPNLLYVSGKESNIEIHLDDEMKEIGYYSIRDGDKIIVQL